MAPQQLKTIASLVILTCILDFSINIIYVPYVSNSSFTNVIFWMIQIVTILLQFFSWFFMLTTLREVRFGGYNGVFRKYWPLFVSIGIYLITFIINIIIQFAHMGNENDIYDLWNNGVSLTFWALQRFASTIHYSFSIYYVIKVLANTSQIV